MSRHWDHLILSQVPSPGANQRHFTMQFTPQWTWRWRAEVAATCKNGRKVSRICHGVGAVAIGSQASGITQVMIQFAPGKTQSLHRHPGEAWLYVVEGYGHSFLGTAPDRGQHYRWKKGDLIVVDHFLWHQHFNDDPQREARLVRVHMFDSILETMRALTDPLVLFEEAEDTLLSMQEISQIEWPDDQRPES